MIDSPISTPLSQATLILLAQMAIVTAGLGLMFNFRKIAVRALLLGMFLAGVAILLPQVVYGSAQ
jgi:hypothetical protein